MTARRTDPQYATLRATVAVRARLERHPAARALDSRLQRAQLQRPARRWTQEDPSAFAETRMLAAVEDRRINPVEVYRAAVERSRAEWRGRRSWRD